MTFPHDVVRRAAEIIGTQGPTPTSPGAVGSDGKLRLCAAAALAAAGLELRGGAVARAALETEIASDLADKDVLERAFLKLGWTREACKERLIFNDDCNPFERQERVLAMLEMLAFDA